MKQRKWFLAITAVSIVLFGFLFYVIFLSEPVRPRVKYYSDDSNYITAAGTVRYLAWGPEQSYVFLAFDDIPEEYSDTNFVLNGENLQIVLENGFAEKVQLGTTVEYVSAPRYFWDGYSMPIVELSVNGEILLTFEEGKTNLLDLIRREP